MPITPNIVLRGARRPADFYFDAFGATETTRIPLPHGRLTTAQMHDEVVAAAAPVFA